MALSNHMAVRTELAEYDVNIEMGTTVGGLKETMAQKLDVKTRDLRLFFHGGLLDDPSMPISSAQPGFHDFTVIFCELPIRSLFLRAAHCVSICIFLATVSLVVAASLYPDNVQMILPAPLQHQAPFWFVSVSGMFKLLVVLLIFDLPTKRLVRRIQSKKALLVAEASREVDLIETVLKEGLSGPTASSLLVEPSSPPGEPTDDMKRFQALGIRVIDPMMRIHGKLLSLENTDKDDVCEGSIEETLDRIMSVIISVFMVRGHDIPLQRLQKSCEAFRASQLSITTSDSGNSANDMKKQQDEYSLIPDEESSANVPDASGAYRITKEIVVYDTTTSHKTRICEIEEGTSVKVLEVMPISESGDVWARLETPAGWITLRNAHNGARWAEPHRACHYWNPAALITSETWLRMGFIALLIHYVLVDVSRIHSCFVRDDRALAEVAADALIVLSNSANMSAMICAVSLTLLFSEAMPAIPLVGLWTYRRWRRAAMFAGDKLRSSVVEVSVMLILAPLALSLGSVSCMLDPYLGLDRFALSDMPKLQRLFVLSAVYIYKPVYHGLQILVFLPLVEALWMIVPCFLALVVLASIELMFISRVIFPLSMRLQGTSGLEQRVTLALFKSRLLQWWSYCWVNLFVFVFVCFSVPCAIRRFGGHNISDSISSTFSDRSFVAFSSSLYGSTLSAGTKFANAVAQAWRLFL
eukprot:TRINITY_DN17613_c0_g1_i1.p1 TRINITY_DN17613_c0_g1~~TRINITY_DN17613_c0_g1_i1.p1  ORF type:complete len:698 (-),score=53.23 TRINITY_DN17613_c0_g1_i1:92-2185(-)